MNLLKFYKFEVTLYLFEIEHFLVSSKLNQQLDTPNVYILKGKKMNEPHYIKFKLKQLP